MSVLWLLIPTAYLAICGGLLEQVESIREITRAKKFVLTVPLLHAYFLIRAMTLYFRTHDVKYKEKIKSYFPYKATLIIILFSIAQVEKEEAQLMRKRKNESKSYSVRDWFRITETEVSNVLTGQCADAI